MNNFFNCHIVDLSNWIEGIFYQTSLEVNFFLNYKNNFFSCDFEKNNKLNKTCLMHKQLQTIMYTHGLDECIMINANRH